MQKVLKTNQVKALISKHLDKKIIYNLPKFGLYHKFYYNNGDILYAKTDAGRNIFFCNFSDNINYIEIYHYLYEYLQNKYLIINIYPILSNYITNYITISINGEDLDVDELEFFFNDLSSNIMNYINSIQLLYKL